MGAIVVVTRARGAATTVGAVVVAVVAVALATFAVDGAQSAARTWEDRDRPTAFQQFEVDRRDAGRRVDALAQDDEVVLTCFGWVAFEALARPVYDPCELNQDEPPPGVPIWYVDHGEPFDRGASVPPGLEDYRPVAHVTSTCERHPGFTWFTVYVREGTPADRRTAVAPPVPVGCTRAG